MNENLYNLYKLRILEEIQGESSSLEVSKQIGFNFDKFKRWKTNSKILKWDEFVEVSQKFNLNLGAAFESIRFETDKYEFSSDLFIHLKSFNAFKSNQEVADYLGCHVSVVKRYATGATVPDIETVLKLVDTKANVLNHFVRSIFEDRINNPTLKKMVNADSAHLHFEANLPICSVIEALVATESYKNRSVSSAEWFAQELNIPQQNIENLLQILIQANALEKDQNDTYKGTHNTTNLNALSLPQVRPFVQFICDRMLHYMERKASSDFKPDCKPGYLSYRVFSGSEESMKQINLVLMEANAKILDILEKDESPRLEVRSLLMQTFNLTV